MVDFPKPVMSVSELKKYGYSAKTIYRIVRSTDGRQFAWQATPGGKWLVDTARFSRYLDKLASRPVLPRPSRSRRAAASVTCAQLMAAMPPVPPAAGDDGEEAT